MASPASSPLSLEEAAASPQESLEEAYVRLNMQLFLHLQRRDTDAALRTAEVIRDVLLHSTSSTPHCSGRAGSDSRVLATPSGAGLFYGSPAEQLLRLRGQRKTLALAESASLLSDDDSDEADESQSAASETGSGSSSSSSAVEARSDDGTDSLESDEMELVSNSEADDDNVEGAEEVAMAYSSSNGRQRQQHAAAYLLEEALKAWSQVPTEAGRASSLIAPVKKRASESGTLQPRSQLSCDKMGGKGEAKTSAEEMGRGSTVPSGTTSSPPLHREKAAGDVDDEGAVSDADAAWAQMQAQVAKEMDRLAIVRKHR
ncbi:hypothetical protein GH5_06359 [Leishmania sp. Ghana 2012 LV757]|uniref:hypothetical protein n=1 Tax=Leishmania sp. Ghana 2012 LV757 TaxID=2803181 RepID=UPI001B5D5B3D|nr:hypothetical protein GH5_06359 [Leishmania sp. Ghana 2012 LV757]